MLLAELLVDFGGVVIDPPSTHGHCWACVTDASHQALDHPDRTVVRRFGRSGGLCGNYTKVAPDHFAP